MWILRVSQQISPGSVDDPKFSRHANAQLLQTIFTRSFKVPIQRVPLKFRTKVPLDTNTSMSEPENTNRFFLLWGSHLISGLALVNQATQTKHNLIKTNSWTCPIHCCINTIRSTSCLISHHYFWTTVKHNRFAVLPVCFDSSFQHRNLNLFKSNFISRLKYWLLHYYCRQL